MALVSLVDGPRDIKFELTARAAARESAVLANYKGVDALPEGFDTSGLRERTAQAVDKVLKYRGEKGKQEFTKLAKEFSVSWARGAPRPRREIRTCDAAGWSLRSPARSARPSAHR